MSKRKPLSKKIRFEVFKRDSFTCQYCGQKSPEVILHVDHISPVSKGGSNEIVNLVTSCADCNSGKGARELDDQSVLAKQRAQLDELNERREQLELMLKWREGLREVDEMAIEAAKDHFSEVFGGWALVSPEATSRIRALIKDFGLSVVMDAMDAGAITYCGAGFTEDAVNTALSKLGGICHNLKNPDEKDIRYARGILRNRLHYINEGIAISTLRDAYRLGADPEHLKEMARSTRNWSEWRAEMADLIEDLEDDRGAR